MYCPLANRIPNAFGSLCLSPGAFRASLANCICDCSNVLERDLAKRAVYLPLDCRSTWILNPKFSKTPTREVQSIKQDHPSKETCSKEKHPQPQPRMRALKVAQHNRGQNARISAHPKHSHAKPPPQYFYTAIAVLLLLPQICKAPALKR